MKLRSRIAVQVLSLLLSPAAALAQPPAPARFSRDGSLLRVIFRSLSEGDQNEHVRAVVYSVKTGAVAHAVDLQPDTDVLSTTSDGAEAIISTATSTEHPHLFLLDTDSGQLQPLPDSWIHPDSDLAAAISGDGRLISVYSETESDAPMTVTVYNWPAKTVTAIRTSEYLSAGGGMDGGVTEDGEVEFDSNRAGRKLVDLDTGRVLAKFGWSSVRSAKGAWEVQFPNLSWDDSGTKSVLVKNGKTDITLGKLNVQLPDDELYGQINGAFCGATDRFVMATPLAVTAYALSSGRLLTTFATTTWQDESAKDSDPASVACSPVGTRVAILSGTRLTFHDLK
jgi:hypothetical protein